MEVTKTYNAAGELSMPVVEIRDGQLADVGQVYAPQGPRLTSGTVRTKGPALLVAFWWGDGRESRHSAVPGDGFRVVERLTEFRSTTGVQCAVAVREVDQAGKHEVTWETAPSQGAILWLPHSSTNRASAAKRLPCQEAVSPILPVRSYCEFLPLRLFLLRTPASDRARWIRSRTDARTGPAFGETRLSTDPAAMHS